MEITIWHIMFFAGLGAVCFAIYCDKLAEAYRHATEAMIKSRNTTTIIINGKPTAEQMKMIQEQLSLPAAAIVETQADPMIDLQDSDEIYEDENVDENVDENEELVASTVDVNEAERQEEMVPEITHVQKVGRGGTTEELVEVDLTDVEMDLLKDLGGDDTPPISHSKESSHPKDWVDYGVTERVRNAAPTLSLIDFNNKGDYPVLGVVFDHRETNGGREILFGEPNFKRWVLVDENAYSLKNGMVALITITGKNGRLESVPRDGVMVLQDGALYRWEKKIIPSEKFVI